MAASTNIQLLLYFYIDDYVKAVPYVNPGLNL